MDFKISIIEGQPIWDALPVGKIIHYPLEKRDYRPFAQVRMCVNQTDLFLRMWAFEARPSAQSALIARLNFDPEQFVPGLDIPMMYREMYWASEGYLWEMVQRGDMDVGQMEKDFTKLIAFWKSIYLRKE